MFARAATRENEILLRTALDAGRGRIMGQLFVEALVLAMVAALVAVILFVCLPGGSGTERDPLPPIDEFALVHGRPR